MRYDFDRPLGSRFVEDDDPGRPHFFVYAGILESRLFTVNEKMLIVYLLGSAEDSKADSINTASINMDKLSEYMSMDKSSVCRCIRSLEEKGVLVKKETDVGDSADPVETYGILNYISVWECRSSNALRKETDRIKQEVQWDG